MRYGDFIKIFDGPYGVHSAAHQKALCQFHCDCRNFRKPLYLCPRKVARALDGFELQPVAQTFELAKVKGLRCPAKK
jgi:hypothetical protein